MQWNARGLIPKLRELKQHIGNNTYDIICVQGTFLKPDKAVRIEGYNIVRTDRTAGKGGGLAIFLKQDVKYMILPSPPNIEYQIMEISTTTGKLTIVNVYVPPSTNIETDCYQSLFARPNTIIVGDLNVKNSLWNSPTDNARGRAIETLLTQNNFVVLNTGQPTYQNSLGQTSHIDLTLAASRLATKCTWHVLNNAMGSDHAPVVCQLEDILKVENNITSKWKLDKADWQSYQYNCRQQLLLNDPYNDDVNTFNENVVRMITAAANNSVPCRKLNNTRKHKPLPYWNEDIKTAIYRRNCARNKLRRRPTQENVNNYKRQKGLAQHVIKENAEIHWHKYCDTLDNTTKLSLVWNMAKRMNGLSSNTTSRYLITDDGQTVDNNIDKAELFAKKFSEIISPANYSEDFRKRKESVEADTT